MSTIQDLEKTLRRRDENIRELERKLQHKDENILQLEKALRRREDIIRQLEKTSKSYQKKAEEYQKKAEELTSQVDKLQSVMKPVAINGSTLTNEGRRKRAVGISAESGPAPDSSDLESASQKLSKKTPKSDRTKQTIQQAILRNEFLKDLTSHHIETVIEHMYPTDVAKNKMIITEGDTGRHIYVLEEGEVEVTKSGAKLCTLGPGRVLGELAILYNCTRTASVRALTHCKLWAIERRVWQGVIVRMEQKKRHQNLKLLKKIPKFNSFSDTLLGQIADILDEEKFDKGHCIVRQGAIGDTFFIVKSGTVVETRGDGEKHQKVVRTLRPGDFFGEHALDAEENRKSSYIAGDPDGAECLILERQSYKEIKDGKRMSMEIISRRQSSILTDLEFPQLSRGDIKVISTIGVGGFSKVELVQLKNVIGRSFALKTMTKQYIVEMNQEEHTINERNILAECKSDFIVRLHGTMKDSKNLYLLLEGCLGGELYTIIKNNGALAETTVMFYAGCVLEALHYLHSRLIIYRDIKPENLMLDRRGYIKLTDFGFAKKINRGQKTWTFCGTPEYIAPEIIRNKGHDMSADLWSLGALLFELLVGRALFSGSDQMQTYQFVLKGVELVEFPEIVKKQAKNLIKKLCRDNPADRLGYGKGGISDIRKHKWFEGYNWEGLRSGTLQAPIPVQVRSSTDTMNFDNFSSEADDEDPPDYDDDEVIINWDPDF